MRDDTDQASVAVLSMMPVMVGIFRSEEGWVQVDYGTGNIPIPRSKYEEINTSRILINCRQKRSIWLRRKKKWDSSVFTEVLAHYCTRSSEVRDSRNSSIRASELPSCTRLIHPMGRWLRGLFIHLGLLLRSFQPITEARTENQ